MEPKKTQNQQHQKLALWKDQYNWQFLPWLTKRKIEKMQITRIRNKGKAISNKLKKFKRIVSEYHKQWSTKLDNQ